ncbi:MAG TPA: methylglyoxal synthase [Burkholderiaceae bacterium]|nr:methylglyoxal synthase [Burkholderiaceae bacterium]
MIPASPTPFTPAHPRIGLAANRLHHDTPDAALFRLLREIEPRLRETLRPTLLIVGRTFDAIEREGLLAGYEAIQRLPYGREGGLMRLVARAVDPDPEAAIDMAIYLIDPVDPSSTFPEAVALKRQCIIHGKPFVSTLLGAREWFELRAVATGAPPNPALDPLFDFGSQSIALVAHDARKTEMVELVREHFEVFDRFASRVATGTTGGLLNELARKLRPERSTPWVRALKSGPLGGDAQIAELLLDGACQRVLFLEDPHVARQHEADIQLLERAARTMSERVACYGDLASARAWLADLDRRAAISPARC